MAARRCSRDAAQLRAAQRSSAQRSDARHGGVPRCTAPSLPRTGSCPRTGPFAHSRVAREDDKGARSRWRARVVSRETARLANWAGVLSHTGCLGRSSPQPPRVTSRPAAPAHCGHRPAAPLRLLLRRPDRATTSRKHPSTKPGHSVPPDVAPLPRCAPGAQQRRTRRAHESPLDSLTVPRRTGTTLRGALFHVKHPP